LEENILNNKSDIQKNTMDTTDLLLLNDDEEPISKHDQNITKKETKFASVIDLLDDLPISSSTNSLL
jgi:hypothetical protein